MLCCSVDCRKAKECDLYYTNHLGTYQVEDFSNYGSCSISSEGIKANYVCGELADYKLFAPVKMAEDEFIVFHCNHCGTQLCTGIHSEWFDGCRFRSHLK